MSKIVGYKYIGIVNGLQQFEPIIEEEKDLTQQIVSSWYKGVEDSLRDKLNQPWSYNELWPFVNTSRHIDSLKSLEIKEPPPYTIETDYIRGIPVRYIKGFVDNHKLIRTIEPYHTKEQCDNLWYNTVHQYYRGEYEG